MSAFAPTDSNAFAGTSTAASGFYSSQASGEIRRSQSFSWDGGSAKSTLKRPKDQRGTVIEQGQQHRQEKRQKVDKHRPPHYIEKFRLSQICFGIIKTKLFKYNFYVLIMANAIEMGMSLAYDKPENDDMWWAFDAAFALLWTIETFVLLFALAHRLFRNFWHTLSFLCTCAAIADIVFRTTSLGEEFKMTSQFIRTTRLLMLGKLFDINAQTKIIVTALVRSLGALRGVLVVILVICYASTLMVFSVVNNKEDEYKAIDFGEMNIEFDFDTHFGNMSKTMLTLFSVLIVSEWDSVARATFRVQPSFTIFWVVYTVILSFGLTNVLVGIIVDTVNSLNQEHLESQAEHARQQLKGAIAQITNIIFGEDDDVEFDEFIEATTNNDVVIDTLSELHVPAGFTFGDLFAVLDDDKDGIIKKTDLSDGLFSLVSGNENARFLLQSVHISRCHTDIVECRADVVERTNAILQVLQGIETRAARSRAVTADEQGVTQTATIASSVPDRMPREAVDYAAPPLKPKNPRAGVPTDELWNQCYQTLYDSAAKHCKIELDAAWVRLQEAYRTIKTDMSQGGIMPVTDQEIADQEQLVVRSKLHAAVCSESAGQLRKALDHAIAIGIDSSQLNVEFTYNDALKRNDEAPLPVTEVKEAMDKGDWSSALDIVIESALKFGVNKNILANVLTRVADSASDTSGQFVTGSNDMGLGNAISNVPNPSLASGSVSAEPTVAGRVGMVRTMEIKTKEGKNNLSNEPMSPGFPTNSSRQYQINILSDQETQRNFLSLLHSEACKHSQEAMDRAWEALEASGKLQSRMFRSDLSARGPDALSPPEEAFFIYNHLCCAVQRKSLAELQRAIGQAIAAGLDIRTIDVEIAYRDALARYHKGSSYITRLAVDAFKRREWYLTLDLLVQVALARGGDRQSLLRAVGKIYTDNEKVFSTI